MGKRRAGPGHCPGGGQCAFAAPHTPGSIRKQLVPVMDEYAKNCRYSPSGAPSKV